ncbi:16S rRNA (guanine(966)-N(2))-methyltransferase RsmD [Maribellus sp. YY47]|uniref:16S rRNA (guanine(966)-N(2))-methyltransferase RsmD n=1 Tax=Maribellus sp. YY47 TaxID=2929486 RepID=UPI002000843D|nr:16S rRNA (guanine(966)-N(2))-methyltransferase RsmD [Maribellus sp. YY47]MCK3683304.1 16S rRNA (guanine(966)-N(2))-methyltransferase RsmD [Maribellus sp. YY47]
MRIVGGKYKGRMFHPGKKFKARPTTDVAKEGLFNILENRYEFSTKKVLDLFSGTGSMGYEFVSRGSRQVTLVESNFNHYKFILEVLEALNIENARVFKADVFKFLQKSRDSFNIIFADPPYDLPNFEAVPEAVLSTDLLTPEGVFILEHPKEYDFSTHPSFKEMRHYGKVHFSFFEK